MAIFLLQENSNSALIPHRFFMRALRMNKFSCPHCNKHLAFRLDQFGKMMKCPKCNRQIKIGYTKADETPAKGHGVAAAFLNQERLKVVLASGLVALAAYMVWNAFAF
jgi:phage FluMu protein Com